MNLYDRHTWSAAAEDLENRQAPFSSSSYAGLKRQVSMKDVLMCYVIGAKRFVGALEVASAPYLYQGMAARRLGLYPVRIDVSPILTVPLEQGILLSAVREQSDTPDALSAVYRGGIRQVPPEDAEWIMRELQRVARKNDRPDPGTRRSS